MKYYYETIREPRRSGEGKHGVTHPGVWHVYNPNKSEPVAVCHDRSDAEAIVKLFNETHQL